MYQKLLFSERVSTRFFSKNRTFYQLCFLGKSTQKKSFFYILDKKRLLFRPEIWSSSLWKFFKGVSPWFWSKHRTFYHVSFLAKLSKERSFFDILNKQECFSDQQNRVLVKSTRWRFCKGVSVCFLSKNGNFLLCGFFQQINSEKIQFLYSG